MREVNLGSFVAMCFWMMPFVKGRHLRVDESIGHHNWLSVAAGMSIAYVFLDLLPQMSRMQELFLTASTTRNLPFPQFRVYASAMVGFVVFYVLENMVVFSRLRRRENEHEHRLPTYWLHLLGFTLYCAVMGYLLHEEAERSVLSLALYSVAMFVHFWIVDHSLRAEHAARYYRSGRWIMASGILAGWAVGLSGLSSDFVLPTLLGFIAGGVVINSIKEELPGKGEGRAFPFVLGTVGYALLISLTELEGIPYVD